DTHGCLLNHDYSHKGTINSGMNLLSSLIKQHRTTNTLLIDTGDAIQGSPLLYFHQINHKRFSNPVATVFNYLGYDYYVPGNHDFNYGIDYLKTFVQGLSAKTLCANILNDQQEPLFSHAYDLKQYENGPKVAILGITTQYIPKWEKPENIRDFQFVHAVTKTKELVEEIKEKHQPDLIILGYHGGLERDLDTDALLVEDTGENLGHRIIESVPDLDIVLTGHQHRIICKKKNKTLVTQPGGSAQYLGKVEVTMEFSGKWQVKEYQAKMLNTTNVAPDPLVNQIIADVEKAPQLFLDEPIGYVPHNDLEVKDGFLARLYKHKIVSFINRVQLEVSKAQISLTALANHVSGFKQRITIRDILNTYVYPNTLVVKRIDGKTLKAALEKNAQYFVIVNDAITVNPKFIYPKAEHYNYDMFDGIEYTIKVSNPEGAKILNLCYQNRVIKDDDCFHIVMNNYRSTGGGEFLMYKNLPVVKEINQDVAEIMIDYIRKTKDIIQDDPKNIRIIK
nr:bifunctional UDP-sugar hydrolase/5'-nucleotidase [Bacilli bacterium]